MRKSNSYRLNKTEKVKFVKSVKVNLGIRKPPQGTVEHRTLDIVVVETLYLK